MVLVTIYESFFNMNLKITSFNCNSIRRNIDIIREIMKYSDIVLLQEICLTVEDIIFCDSIDVSFEFVINPSVYGDENVTCEGRPKGGVAIFWKKFIGVKIIPLTFVNNIIGVKIISGNKEWLILNVYFPCENYSREALCLYREQLAELHNILTDEVPVNVVIAGDFNADPSKGRFWSELKSFTDSLLFDVADLSLPIDTFTYLSPAHSSTSWLDHVVTSDRESITNIVVGYDRCIYDHFPLTFDVDVGDLNYTKNPKKGIESKKFINWTKFSEEMRVAYATRLEDFFENYWNEALFCNNKVCSSGVHKDKLNEAYAFLVESILKSSEEFQFDNGKKNNITPGWNDHCRHKYNDAKMAFLVWKQKGKIRVGFEFDNMKKTRLEFRNALKFCRSNEESIRNEKLFSSLQEKNKTEFWRKVRQIKGKSISYASIIDGESDSQAVVECFSMKYKGIFDDINSQDRPVEFDNQINDYCSNDYYKRVTQRQIQVALSSLKCGVGWDSIHSNHLKFAPPAVIGFLSKFFSSAIAHRHLPEDMLMGEIRPIIKNKFGNLNSSDNYRPIMISSNLLKLFEYCLLQDLENLIKLNLNQYGFRKNTSTIMAVTMVKETIFSYSAGNTCVFASFLDMSKAFDRVNHFKLLRKLMSLGIPSYMIAILFNMYRNQNVYVTFNNCISNVWKLGNGVRQGGIISPLLFNFYIDEVLNCVTTMNVGCKLGLKMNNIQAYADDIVLLAPTASGLQILLNRVSNQLRELGLVLNADKSTCMIFNSKSTSVINQSCVIDNLKIPIVKSHKFLGIILSDDMRNGEDLIRCEKTFLREFYSIYRKFHSSNVDVLISLFKSHCLTFYGSQLWHDNTGCQKNFKSLGISYHKSLKKILNMPWRESNHFVCDRVNMLTCNHLLNMYMFRYIFSLLKSNSVCIVPFKLYLSDQSKIVRDIIEIARKCYNIENLLDNDFDAIVSRIQYVQDREESTR